MATRHTHPPVAAYWTRTGIVLTRGVCAFWYYVMGYQPASFPRSARWRRGHAMPAKLLQAMRAQAKADGCEVVR